jgi:hypothetical protein
MKFTFKSIDEDGTITIKESSDVVLLDEAVGMVSDFLRGCGYYFETLEVVRDPESEVETTSTQRKSVYLSENLMDR